MSETPYPAGTMCIIIQKPSFFPTKCLYQVVKVGSRSQPSAAHTEWSKIVDDGAMLQEITDAELQLPPPPGNNWWAWPVAWLRPLEDPDAQGITEEEREALYAASN